MFRLALHKQCRRPNKPTQVTMVWRHMLDALAICPHDHPPTTHPSMRRRRKPPRRRRRRARRGECGASAAWRGTRRGHTPPPQAPPNLPAANKRPRRPKLAPSRLASAAGAIRWSRRPLPAKTMSTCRQTSMRLPETRLIAGTTPRSSRGAAEAAQLDGVALDKSDGREPGRVADNVDRRSHRFARRDVGHAPRAIDEPRRWRGRGALAPRHPQRAQRSGQSWGQRSRGARGQRTPERRCRDLGCRAAVHTAPCWA